MGKVRKKWVWIFICLLSVLYVKAQTSSTLNVSTAGTLSTLLGSNIDVVKNLTLTGSINGTDFITIRRMDSLSVLNLKNVKIVSGGLYYYDANYTEDNKVTNYMFYGLSHLTSVVLPTSVTSIGDYVFDGCSALISVTIPTSVTSIGHRAFAGCSALPAITFPSNVSTVGSGAFDGCLKLTSVALPAKITAVTEYLFNGCSSLISVTIPSKVKTIGRSAFDGCSTLISATMPGTVTSIGVNAFYGCVGLDTLVVPDAVTTVGENAYACCSGLTTVTIGSKVTSMGIYSFYGCTGLTEIHSRATTAPTLTGEVFEGVDKVSCVLYVPVGAEGEYSSAMGWSDFTNVIEEEITGLEDVHFDRVRFYTADGQLYLQTEESSIVSVYSLSGQKVFEQTVTGDVQIPLQRGVYLVKVGKQATKVFLK